MTTEQFWTIIESSRSQIDPNLLNGNQDRQAQLLEKLLRTLNPRELEDYERLFNEFFFKSYTWEIWAAVYLIEGGCSDDGFDYFRSWLISLGEAAFEAVIRSADNLAHFAYLPEVEVISFPEIISLAALVYEEKTGNSIPESCYEPGRPNEPSGTPWDENNLSELKPRLPKVWERCRESWPSGYLD